MSDTNILPLEKKLEKLRSVYPNDVLEELKQTAIKINEIKKQKNAVIMAHNYMTPDIYHLVSDIVGDSLALAIEAKKTKADIIVMAGVHFMAETAKILNKDKKVLIPDMDAGCSLADSITGEDVRNLKKQYPGIPVITYVNTSADVKAETDICCTSGNVEKIVKACNKKEVILIPDKYLAGNVEKSTGVKCITWEKGACEVHELFTKEEVLHIKKQDKNVKVIAHPECPKEVVEVSDFSGSTAQMIDFVKNEKPEKVALITECSMSQNIQELSPDTQFIGMCRMCPHMKKITLDNILTCLIDEKHEIKLDDEIISKSKSAIDKMIEFSK